MATLSSGDRRKIVLPKEIVQSFLKKLLHGSILIESDFLDLLRYFWIEESGDRLLPCPGRSDGL